MAAPSRPSCRRSTRASSWVISIRSSYFRCTDTVRSQVIVDGSSEAIQDLAGACKAVTSMTEDIYTPSLGETIKVGEETKNFSIRLGDSIMATLRLSRVSHNPARLCEAGTDAFTRRLKTTTLPTSRASSTSTPSPTCPSSNDRLSLMLLQHPLRCPRPKGPTLPSQTAAKRLRR